MMTKQKPFLYICKIAYFQFAATCYETILVPSQDVVVSSDRLRPDASTEYTLDGPKSWCVTKEDADNYIELVFNFVHNITGFAIGGSRKKDNPNFVKKFKFFSKVFKWDSWSPVIVNGTEV